MQINSASLLAAQQARTQTAMPQQRAAAAKTQADELFEPLFGKSEVKAASSSPSTPNAAPAKFTRPGSQIDIRV